MKTNFSKDLFGDSDLIKLKDNNWLEKQRVAGKVAAKTLLLLESFVKEKTTKSLIELNKIAEDYITSHVDCSCTFKNYKGFPNGVCISVNNELVHGICKDYKLQDGDLVSFDLGVTYQGAIADTAITYIYGEPKSDKHVKLVKDTEEALMRGIKAIKVGERLGVIGSAISKYAKGYGLITQYGGHGISWNTPHDSPFVSNKSSPNEGIRIRPGLAIAVEPMLTLGSISTTTAEDGWTVMCKDLNAHWEHSIYVHENGNVEIITDRSNL